MLLIVISINNCFAELLYMDIFKIFNRYGTLIAGILLIITVPLAMFVPMVLTFDIDSNWIQFGTILMGIKLQTGNPPELTTLLDTLECIPFFFSPFIAIILVLVGGIFTFISAFTINKPKLTRIFRAIGLSLACFGFIMMVSISSYYALTRFPFNISIVNFGTDKNSIPLVGFFTGVLGAIVGVVSMKLSRWEKLD